MLTSLDNLILKCQTERSKKYIQEAIACYNAAAYKAAIVCTWIAVVYDIYEKIHDLSMNGDGKAKEEFEKIEKLQKELQKGNNQAIGNLLNCEREILDKAHLKFEFIDFYQYDELKRLQEDRHKCAHPTFQRDFTPFNPSAELALIHIRNSVEFLLSQPPLQGKSALQVINNILTSDFLPSENRQIKEALMSTPFAKPSPALIKALVGDLVYDIFENKIYKNRHFKILSIIADLHPLDTLKEIKRLLPNLYSQVQSKQKFSRFVGLITLLPQIDLWNNIPQSYQNAIKQFIKEGKPSTVAWALGKNPQIKDLKTTINAFILSVSADDLIQIFTSPFASNILFTMFKERIITLYKQANKWETNNEIVRELLTPFFYLLSKEDIQELKKFIFEDENIKKSNSLPLLIKNIYEYGCNFSVKEKQLFDQELTRYGLSNMILTDEEFEKILPF